MTIKELLSAAISAAIIKAANQSDFYNLGRYQQMETQFKQNKKLTKAEIFDLETYLRGWH